MLNLNLKAENELTGEEGRMFQALETAVKRSWRTSQNAEGNCMGEGIKVVRTGTVVLFLILEIMLSALGALLAAGLSYI